MTRRKQVYKITYPNGKIYVGMDLTGTALYMGSPSAHEQIVADLELEPGQFERTLRKEILWESETAVPLKETGHPPPTSTLTPKTSPTPQNGSTDSSRFENRDSGLPEVVR